MKGIAGRYDQVIQDTVHSLLRWTLLSDPRPPLSSPASNCAAATATSPPRPQLPAQGQGSAGTVRSTLNPDRGTVQQARSTGEFDTRSTSAQTTPSLYHPDPTPQPDRCPGRTNVQQSQSTREKVSASAQTTPSLYRCDSMPQPSVESLSVVLVHIVNSKDSAKAQPRVLCVPRPASGVERELQFLLSWTSSRLQPYGRHRPDHGVDRR